MTVSNISSNETVLSPGGEIWKDIPGFEGSFQASDKGRIRSIDRIVPHKRCGSQFVKGRILKPNVKKHYNNYTKDHMVILQVTLMLENVRYEYSVRRLVYAAFRKKEFRLNTTKMILGIDGNGYNNELSNLQAADNSERMKLVARRNRMPKRGKTAPGTVLKPTFALWKPVHRCDQNGRILATYPCIAAARKEGFTEKMITDAAKGRIKQYKGFRWRYASRKYLHAFIQNWQLPNVISVADNI